MPEMLHSRKPNGERHEDFDTGDRGSVSDDGGVRCIQKRCPSCRTRFRYSGVRDVPSHDDSSDGTKGS